jgi:asparagine synthase (glutamine-hydrolysing)
MCGITGAFDYQRRGQAIDPQVVDRMTDALAHRGPNGRGIFQVPGLAFGHRRLSVLDPSAAGTQPMRHAARNLVVTFNGEIYNFRELRHELEALGHRFQTECDTEVILAAYAEWGTAAVERFNGIFAFALWDAPEERLWLVRDRLGVKPLYYTTQGGILRFGSEVKAILADPSFQRRPNASGLDSFLSFGFIPAPETGFEDIYQLLPAHDMVVERGQIRIRQYWQLRMGEANYTPEVAQELFAEKFQQAVRRQLVSDVPLGGFLSGGVDSAAVVAEMARASNQAVRTFSAGFEDASFDERSAAAETAKAIGTDHTELLVKLDVDHTVEKFLELNDDPFADSSSLAVYHLCQSAAKQVTVALSGDGADEMLGGYSTYSATVLASTYRWLPRWSRALVRQVVASLPASNSRYNIQQFASRFVSGAEEPEGRDFGSWRIHFSGRNKTSLCRPHFLQPDSDPVGVYAGHYHAAPGAETRLKKMLHADLTFYLPSDMLVKVDRMSMAHGLEVRVPFLDHELVELCATLPSNQLARLPFPKQNKLILRRHLKEKLGTDVSQRKKTGFNVPIEKAMRGELATRFRDAVSSTRFRQEGPFDVDKLLQHADQHARHEIDAGHALFSALVLADWWERWLHCDGQ